MKWTRKDTWRLVAFLCAGWAMRLWGQHDVLSWWTLFSFVPAFLSFHAADRAEEEAVRAFARELKEPVDRAVALVDAQRRSTHELWVYASEWMRRRDAEG